MAVTSVYVAAAEWHRHHCGHRHHGAGGGQGGGGGGQPLPARDGGEQGRGLDGGAVEGGQPAPVRQLQPPGDTQQRGLSTFKYYEPKGDMMYSAA